MIEIRNRWNGAVDVSDKSTCTHFVPAGVIVDIFPAHGIVQLHCDGKYQPEQVLPVGGKASYMIGTDYRITVERVSQSKKVIKLRRRSTEKGGSS